MFKATERVDYVMRFSKTTKVVLVFMLVGLSILFDSIDARKTNSGSSRRTGGVNSGRVNKPQGYANPNIASLSYGPGQAAVPRPQPSAPKHADPSIAQFSYGANQPAISKQAVPIQHSAPPLPSAPVVPAPVAPPAPGARPIGWNVDNNQVAVNKQSLNSAPYPLHHPVQNPSYSGAPNHGAPPTYSQYPSSNVGAPGFQVNPTYSGGHPVQNPGYPTSGYQVPSGYTMQQYSSGGFPAGQPQIINNHYGSPGGVSSSGSGLQTALLAGVGGLALYGALKPTETKTIIIDNTAHIVPQNATVPEGAMVLPANATLPLGVALAPLQVATEQPVLLAAYPGTDNSTTGSSTTLPNLNVTSAENGTSTEQYNLLQSTGLYPSISTVSTAEIIDVQTDVPLAPYPGGETTPAPIALSSLGDSQKAIRSKSSVASIQVKILLVFLPLLKLVF